MLPARFAVKVVMVGVAAKLNLELAFPWTNATPLKTPVMVTVPVPFVMVASTAPDKTTVKLSPSSRFALVSGVVLARIGTMICAVDCPAAKFSVPVTALKSEVLAEPATVVKFTLAGA